MWIYEVVRKCTCRGTRRIQNHQTRKSSLDRKIQTEMDPSRSFSNGSGNIWTVAPHNSTNCRNCTKPSFPNQVSIQWLLPCAGNSPRLPDPVDKSGTSKQDAFAFRWTPINPPYSKFLFDLSIPFFHHSQNIGRKSLHS